MSSERSSWMDRDATQACSTTRWVDWGVSCPRKERYPKFGHVPLAVCRVADDELCVCVFEISEEAGYFLWLAA